MNVQVCWIETSASAVLLRRALRSIPLVHSPESRDSSFLSAISNLLICILSHLPAITTISQYEAQVNGWVLRVPLKVSTKGSNKDLNILSARHKLKVASVHPSTWEDMAARLSIGIIGSCCLILFFETQSKHPQIARRYCSLYLGAVLPLPLSKRAPVFA